MPQDPLFLLAANLSVAVLVRILKPNLVTGLLLAVVLIGSTGYLGSQYSTEIIAAYYQGRDLTLTMSGRPPSWPPEKNRSFPDLKLIDQEGKEVALSLLKGNIVLVELVGMSCRACVAFAGGHERGPFHEVAPQASLDSLENYGRRFGRVRLDDERLVFVQLILFNHDMKAPTEEDVRQWAEHFGMNRARNQLVLAGTPSMASTASRQLIPGFYLIDRDFVVRADSTGPRPQDNLYHDLLPTIRKLFKE